jgi:hypothetical protein
MEPEGYYLVHENHPLAAYPELDESNPRHPILFL